MAAMLVSETKEMGVVEALGNIFAFGPQAPQFDPRLCRDWNVCATLFFA